jgi:hypothetical protein
MRLLELTKSAHITFNDSRFNYPYKGYGSIVCGIIDIALEHYMEYGNYNILVDEPQTLELFDCISNSTDQLYDAGSWFLQKYFSNTLTYSKYNAHTIANISNLKIKNKIFNKILKIKDNYLQEFNHTYIELGLDQNTLAIQIRGTDKKDELPEIKTERIFDLINYHLTIHTTSNIFVATDDKRYLNALIDRYSDLIVYDKNIIMSEDSQPLHHNTPIRSKLNEQVLSSVYMLSKCNHFLYSFSNVSLLALTMGANNFKSITNINK